MGSAHGLRLLTERDWLCVGSVRSLDEASMGVGRNTQPGSRLGCSTPLACGSLWVGPGDVRLSVGAVLHTASPAAQEPRGRLGWLLGVIRFRLPGIAGL